MRFVVGIHSGQDPTAVADALRGAGAQHVQAPAQSLPDVLVADFPEGDAERTIESVSALPGVRYAEADAMQDIS